MLEWLKRHAWKACIPQKGISGSNPDLSAEKTAAWCDSTGLFCCMANGVLALRETCNKTARTAAGRGLPSLFCASSPTGIARAKRAESHSLRHLTPSYSGFALAYR